MMKRCSRKISSAGRCCHYLLFLIFKVVTLNLTLKYVALYCIHKIVGVFIFSYHIFWSRLTLKVQGVISSNNNMLRKNYPNPSRKWEGLLGAERKESRLLPLYALMIISWQLLKLISIICTPIYKIISRLKVVVCIHLITNLRIDLQEPMKYQIVLEKVLCRSITTNNFMCIQSSQASTANACKTTNC